MNPALWYALGIATPFTACGFWFLLIRPGFWNARGCAVCERTIRAGRFEPWWEFTIRSSVWLGRHMKTRTECRVEANYWFASAGSETRWVKWRWVPGAIRRKAKGGT